MPDFSPDYTFRYKVKYVAAGITHDFVVRSGILTSGGETEAGDLANAVGQYFAAIESQLVADFEFLVASWAYAGSNIFVPTDAIPAQPTGVIAVNTLSGRRRATAFNMAGRGSGEGSCRLYFFGLAFSDSAPGDAGSNAVIDVEDFPAVADAKAIADASFRASDGQSGIYYPRFTTKVNDRTLRLIRRLAD